MACRGLCSCSSPSFRLTEDTTRLLLLAVLTVLYMICGAAIFTVIEHPSEVEAFQKWQIKIENFSQKYNLPLAELRGFLFEYEAAYRLGIRINVTRPHWDLVGSFYFVGTVFSTVGFGRTTPTTRTGKLFLIFYGLIGCAATILFFNLFLERLITVIGSVMKTYHKRKLKRKLPKDVQQAGIDEVDNLAGWKPSVYHVMLILCLVSVIVSCSASAMFSATEGWSYSDSLYYCFVAFSTIGFGDMLSGWNPYYRYQHLYRFGNSVVILIGICFIYSLFNVIAIVIKQFLNWILKKMGSTCRKCRRKLLRSQKNVVMPGTVWRQRNVSIESDGVLDSESEGRRVSGEMSMKDLLAANKVSLAAIQKQLAEIPHHRPPVPNGFAGGVGALGIVSNRVAETRTDR
ncbi:potassium channel subfamily K member 13 [Pantherophis guttatus]|uniref:Potassium channel subfamily K member 13 n=1 Tax=Pantherophis guttatus TaxID=94885 RepID=A0A6P9BW26_PANGU|nr:potassium channel subfamily K member 13 [Pantherophis guttatus]